MSFKKILAKWHFYFGPNLLRVAQKNNCRNEIISCFFKKKFGYYGKS